MKLVATGAKNEHDSRRSHVVDKPDAATVNRRVASSNLARGTGQQNFVRVFLFESARPEGPSLESCHSRENATSCTLMVVVAK